MVGCIMRIDHFGNLITNLEAKDVLSPGAKTVIHVAGQQVRGLASSYQEGEPLVGIIGSHGYLEIGAASANASEMLGAGAGDEVIVSTDGA